MNIADRKAGARALKNVSVQQLETAISAALYKITAAKYHVDIKRFDFDLGAAQPHQDGAVIEMSVVDAPAACAAGEPAASKPECGGSQPG